MDHYKINVGTLLDLRDIGREIHAGVKGNVGWLIGCGLNIGVGVKVERVDNREVVLEVEG